MEWRKYLLPVGELPPMKDDKGNIVKDAVVQKDVQSYSRQDILNFILVSLVVFLVVLIVVFLTTRKTVQM